MARSFQKDHCGTLIGLLVVCALSTTDVLVGELPPGHQIDEMETCLGCHDLEEALTARVKHAPVAQGECSACHNPHVSRFAALLRDRPAPLCQSCHDQIEAELRRPAVHAPVAEGRCFDCHEVHGSANQGLLKQPGAALCGECHDVVSSWEARPVKHRPFAQGTCAACHEAHAAEGRGLLKFSGARSCLGCHDTGGSFRAKHHGYPVEKASCQQCHDPHASSKPGMLRQRLHEPFEGNSCSTCHLAADAADPFSTQTSVIELCGECHADEASRVRSAPFAHVSAGLGSCTACHNPHTGDGDGMLHKEQQELCLNCHDPGGSASKQPGSYRTHADDIECTVCHDPHGGDRPLMFREDSIDLCGQCHTHEHGIRHPLGEETRDPRTGSPMSCRSCHGVHQADHDMYLFASDDGELCIRCHKNLGGRS